MTSLLPSLLANAGMDVPLWAVIPFILLLALIAIMPLSPTKVKHLWEKYYPWVAAALGLVVVIFYTVKFGAGEGLTRTGHSLHEYVSFICLIGSLFVVSGGMHIRVAAGATPAANVLLLFLGAILSNFIGTTGASMLLIRPFIQMNKGRISAYHVVFFIFIVSNAGGALTPIGDPPLFLGYLRGVPFFWLVEHAILPWAFTIGALLAIFYIFDASNHRKAIASANKEDAPPAQGARISVEGLGNVLALFVIIVAVFVETNFYLREIMMVAAAFASQKLTPKRIHEANAFNFGPIKEVAFLFFGIFLTMMPALDYLDKHGKELAFEEPYHFYFATGALSSVLDNAPTYLNYLKLTQVVEVPEDFRAAHPDEKAWTQYIISHTDTQAYLIAVSLGAVFFGAMTYIGNGPNFMVKSIAESSNVQMPTFFGYIFKFAVPFLLPILIIVAFAFIGKRPPAQQIRELPTPPAATAPAVPAAHTP